MFVTINVRLNEINMFKPSSGVLSIYHVSTGCAGIIGILFSCHDMKRHAFKII